MVAVNNLFTSRLQTIQQQQILKSGNINEQNISLFENTSGLTQGMVDGSCTDCYDDGKISFGEGVKSFFKGAVKSVTNMFSSPKNFLKTLAVGVGSAALIAVTGGAATPFLIAGGAIAGGVQVGKGIYDASQATTDAEKKQALENIGGGTATLAMSVAGAKSYAKTTGNALIGKGSLATYKNAASQSVANVKTNFGNLTSSIKSAPSALKSKISDTVKTYDETINWTEDAKVLKELLAEDSKATIECFSKDMVVEFSKSISHSVKDLSQLQLNQAKALISSAKNSNLNINNLVSQLNEMGIGKAAAMELIQASNSMSTNNEQVAASKLNEYYM